MRKSTHPTSLLVLTLACFAATSLACTCLPQTFLEAYLSADSVVKAKVLSVTRYAPGCSGKACLIPPKFAGFLLVKFRLRQRFKKCGPSEIIFFGKTASQSAACGFPFKVGKVYMLNLPRPTFVRRLGQPTKFYILSICQNHRLYSSLSSNQKKLLPLLFKEPENRCLRRIAVAS